MVQDTSVQNEDRIKILKKRIDRLRTESVDMQFSAYLDQVLSNLENEEAKLQKIERHLEQNYQFYLRRNAIKLQQNQQPMPPQTAGQPVQPFAESQQPMPPQMTGQPVQPFAESQQPMPPQMAGQPVQPFAESQQPIPPQMAGQPVLQPSQQLPAEKNNMSSRTWEFKIGTFVLGLVGTSFLLVALVYLFMQITSTILQGVLFYVLSIGVFAFSELFLAKRLEKFSYFMSGLGIAGIYITTILNYLYLKLLPSWAALLITVIVTGFFFWLSRVRDSGMLRIICLLGCYISMIPLGDLENLTAFILPAAIIFVLNLAGFLCPIKKGNQVIDCIQYICTILLSGRMVYLLFISGLQMWPFYIFMCCNILTLHLLCYKKMDQSSYQILYCLVFGIFEGFLLYIGYHENWMMFGVMGLSVLGIGFMFMFQRTKMRFAPYVFTAVYAFLAFAMEKDSFSLTVVCILIFVINRLLAVFTNGFEVVDAVYTMFAVWGVCLACRSNELRMPGYIFACLILIGAFFVVKLKRYHLYIAVSFAWLFLITETAYPLICSVLVCILAACMIGGGFLKKEKGVRIYGLCLMIFIALKLAAYDFKEAEALIRIMVFSIVGLVILGISFLYIYLEKKQNDSEEIG